MVELLRMRPRISHTQNGELEVTSALTKLSEPQSNKVGLTNGLGGVYRRLCGHTWTQTQENTLGLKSSQQDGFMGETGHGLLTKEWGLAFLCHRLC